MPLEKRLSLCLSPLGKASINVKINVKIRQARGGEVLKRTSAFRDSFPQQHQMLGDKKKKKPSLHAQLVNTQILVG